MTSTLRFLLVTAAAGFIASSGAQEICPCMSALQAQTKLEALTTNTGTMVITSGSVIGSIAAPNGGVTVKCREISEPTTGRRELGIAVELTLAAQAEESLLVDYEELDALLNAIDELNKLDWHATSLTIFDAVYTTRGGLRVAAHGFKRTGTIEYAVRSARLAKCSVSLSRAQLAELRSLVDQAKSALVSIKK